MAQTIEIKGIGPVKIERSRKAKRMNITVRPDEGVRVAVPVGVSFSAARSFALAKRTWIRYQLNRISRLKAEFKAHRDLAGDIDIAKAKTKLRNRLADLAAKHGFTYNKVFIKNQKTRWGSCTMKNNINLNIKLVRLPEQLMDYVLLHELVHTRIKNHQAEYWTELNKYVDNAPVLSRKLNRYKLGFMEI